MDAGRIYRNLVRNKGWSSKKNGTETNEHPYALLITPPPKKKTPRQGVITLSNNNSQNPNSHRAVGKEPGRVSPTGDCFTGKRHETQRL